MPEEDQPEQPIIQTNKTVEADPTDPTHLPSDCSGWVGLDWIGVGPVGFSFLLAECTSPSFFSQVSLRASRGGRSALGAK